MNWYEITGLIIGTIGIIIGILGYYIGNQALYIACFVPTGIGYYSFTIPVVNDIMSSINYR